MTEPLGHEPIKRKLLLSAGADFVQRIRRDAGDPEIPLGTVVELIVYDTDGDVADTWAASEITGDYARWEIESEQADVIEAGWTYRLYVRYPRGDATYLDQLWYYGEITRKE